MQAKLYWGDIEEKHVALPDDCPSALESIKAALQILELNLGNGYRSFAGAVNEEEKWGVVLMWKDDDAKHPHVLKVFKGHEPAFDARLLMVGM